MKYWAIKFTNGEEKVFRADEVEKIELLGPETILYSNGEEYSTEDEIIEDISEENEYESSSMSRPFVVGTGTGTGHPLSAMERVQFALERETLVGRVIQMPDGNDWYVVRHVDGVLYIIQRVNDIKIFSPAVHIKHKDEWRWFEERPKGTGIPDSEYPHPKKGENDFSGCCKTKNAHICQDSEKIMKYGFCKACVVRVGGEVDVSATLASRDRIRMLKGLNPIAPGTFPVFANEQLLREANSAIGELLKRDSNNADEWKNAFKEAMEDGKELDWRNENGED